jgi:hypothetical protein
VKCQIYGKLKKPLLAASNLNTPKSNSIKATVANKESDKK